MIDGGEPSTQGVREGGCTEMFKMCNTTCNVFLKVSLGRSHEVT